MKFTHRTAALLMILSILLSSAACSNKNGDDDTDTTQGGASTDTTAPEQPEDDTYYGLPSDIRFNGETVTMLVNTNTKQYFTSSEMTGSVLNDAIYERNSRVGERLNIRFTVEENGGDIYSTVSSFITDILAGDKTYDMFFTHSIAGCTNLLTNKAVVNLNEAETIDFSRPWWNLNIINKISANNRVYFAASDLNFITLDNTFVLLINRAMTQNNGKDDPYQLVRDGKWTIDAMNNQLKGMTMDLNGDGAITPENDQFGLAGIDGSYDVYLYAGGGACVVVEKEGPVIKIGDERSQNILEKVNAMIHGNESYIYGNSTAVENMRVFTEGRAYLMADRIKNIAGYADSDIDYGIMPYPKYDESQQEYYSLSDADGGVMCLPVTLTGDDLNRAGAVMSALSGDSYETVTPIYYNTLLQTRYARDEATVEMIDLIYRSTTYDFGYVYDNWTAGLQSAFWSLISANDNGLSSYVESRRTMAQTHFDSVYQAFYQ